MYSTLLIKETITTSDDLQNQFLKDVIKGLSAKQKYLQSKYFYDAKGDKLFQQIMACPEYYLTKCEMEIFSKQTLELVETFTENHDEFDAVELGAGDATKSTFLLQELLNADVAFTYYPVDISKNVIRLLQRELPAKLPSLEMHPLNGEYFQMLEKAKDLSVKPKVVLFLGSNIGNVPLEEAEEFCALLRSHLSPGDLVLIGFDLKKDPNIILDAYNDKAGYTKDFNLNLLQRINEELEGDFDIDNFVHTPTYDPETGACKSFLTSLTDQQVRVGEETFFFKKGEKIYMEISQKYSADQTDELAVNTGFIPVKHFYDSKQWFLDAIWQCV